MKDKKKDLEFIANILPKKDPGKKEEQLENKVTTYIEPAVAIAKTLSEHGYSFGYTEKDTSPYSRNLLEHVPLDKFGIYVPHQQTKLQRLLFSSKKIPQQVGALYIDGYYPGKSTLAKKNKNWFLNVFGRQYLKELTDIVTKHAQEYEVKLEVFLKTEHPI